MRRSRMPLGWATVWLLFCFGPLTSRSVMIDTSSLMQKITDVSPLHNGQFCSTWGNHHFKTFDGDFFQFPFACNYVLTSSCRSAYEDFNIQLSRQQVDGVASIKRVMMRLDGVLVELANTTLTVDDKQITIPYSQYGLSIQRKGSYVRIEAKLGLVVMWNEYDTLWVEMDEKYMNQTCGLCGDYNGVQLYNEFISHGVEKDTLTYGTSWKVDAPTETCMESHQETTACAGQTNRCTELLSEPAFLSCQGLLNMEAFVEACEKDLCHCGNGSTCLCPTMEEFSRQCAHAGGTPLPWKTAELCADECPFNLEYMQCGNTCRATCAQPESSQPCEEHCESGCFCPAGTVFDDVTQSGCVALQQCYCQHNGKAYGPGESFSGPCRTCNCTLGKWSCQEHDCPATCSFLGGSHITTYDDKSYTFHGECTFVLSKDINGNYIVLGDIAKLSQTDTESLMAVTLLYGAQRKIKIESTGKVFYNDLAHELPLNIDNITVFRPSTFFVVVHAVDGLQLEIQIVPTMQLYIKVDVSYKGQLRGLCGDFNDVEADDFKTTNGMIAATAATYANTWRAQPSCPDVTNRISNPCSLSVDKERYSNYWCASLSHANGIFAPCHSEIDPSVYEVACRHDTCLCERSEDCMCAALSSYVHACRAVGVSLKGWRNTTCTKYSSSCPEGLVYSYRLTGCQPSCRGLSQPHASCQMAFSPVDGCGCAPGTYLNEEGRCVPASQCCCYEGDVVIRPGQTHWKQGTACTCRDGVQHCVGKATSCTAPMVFFNCSGLQQGARGSECQKSCRSENSECISDRCVSGCMCPEGSLTDGAGGCVKEDLCPCLYNSVSYTPGQTVKVDCNTCECRARKWECTTHECDGICTIYGDGHYISFDEKKFSFNGDCGYTFAQDYCHGEMSNGTFRVVTENIPCASIDSTCSTAIKLYLGNTEILLSDEKIKVMKQSHEAEIPYQVHSIGIYLVIEAKNGLILIWNKKTTLMIKLNPSYKGQLCGLCGNYDGSVKNDFTTRNHEVVAEAVQFGNSWKVSPTCPDVDAIKRPCQLYSHRQAWALKHCSIINSEVFAACHSQVDPTNYYDSCVKDTCACNSGGDCECFCSAVEAYAEACNRAGACVRWRTPSICPLFCDFYNPIGECEWHYEPCGDTCLKTCKNPTATCSSQIPAMEGCYPRCPPDQPYLEERTMKCVSEQQCGCYGNNDKHYEEGDTMPSEGNCKTWYDSESGKCSTRGFNRDTRRWTHQQDLNNLSVHYSYSDNYNPGTYNYNIYFFNIWSDHLHNNSATNIFHPNNNRTVFHDNNHRTVYHPNNYRTVYHHNNYRTVYHPNNYRTVYHHNNNYREVYHPNNYRTAYHHSNYRTAYHPNNYRTVYHPNNYRTAYHHSNYRTVYHPNNYRTVYHPNNYGTVYHSSQNNDHIVDNYSSWLPGFNYRTVYHHNNYRTVYHHNNNYRAVYHPNNHRAVYHHNHNYRTVYHPNNYRTAYHPNNYGTVYHPNNYGTVYHSSQNNDHIVDNYSSWLPVYHHSNYRTVYHPNNYRTVYHHNNNYRAVYHPNNHRAVYHHNHNYRTVYHPNNYRTAYHPNNYGTVYHPNNYGTVYHSSQNNDHIVDNYSSWLPVYHHSNYRTVYHPNNYRTVYHHNNNYRAVYHPNNYRTAYHHSNYRTAYHPNNYRTVYHPNNYRTAYHHSNYRTVYHPNNYRTVYHPNNYRTVYHPNNYRTVYHPNNYGTVYHSSQNNDHIVDNYSSWLPAYHHSNYRTAYHPNNYRTVYHPNNNYRTVYHPNNYRTVYHPNNNYRTVYHPNNYRTVYHPNNYRTVYHPNNYGTVYHSSQNNDHIVANYSSWLPVYHHSNYRTVYHPNNYRTVYHHNHNYRAVYHPNNYGTVNHPNYYRTVYNPNNYRTVCHPNNDRTVYHHNNNYRTVYHHNNNNYDTAYHPNNYRTVYYPNNYRTVYHRNNNRTAYHNNNNNRTAYDPNNNRTVYHSINNYSTAYHPNNYRTLYHPNNNYRTVYHPNNYRTVYHHHNNYRTVYHHHNNYSTAYHPNNYRTVYHHNNYRTVYHPNNNYRTVYYPNNYRTVYHPNNNYRTVYHPNNNYRTVYHPNNNYRTVYHPNNYRTVYHHHNNYRTAYHHNNNRTVYHPNNYRTVYHHHNNYRTDYHHNNNYRTVYHHPNNYRTVYHPNNYRTVHHHNNNYRRVYHHNNYRTAYHHNNHRTVDHPNNYRTVYHPNNNYRTVYHHNNNNYDTAYHPNNYRTVYYPNHYRTVYHPNNYGTVYHHNIYSTAYHDNNHRTVYHPNNYRTVYHHNNYRTAYHHNNHRTVDHPNNYRTVDHPNNNYRTVYHHNNNYDTAYHPNNYRTVYYTNHYRTVYHPNNYGTVYHHNIYSTAYHHNNHRTVYHPNNYRTVYHPNNYRTVYHHNNNYRAVYHPNNYGTVNHPNNYRTVYHPNNNYRTVYHHNNNNYDTAYHPNNYRTVYYPNHYRTVYHPNNYGTVYHHNIYSTAYHHNNHRTVYHPNNYGTVNHPNNYRTVYHPNNNYDTAYHPNNYRTVYHHNNYRAVYHPNNYGTVYHPNNYRTAYHHNNFRICSHTYRTYNNFFLC
ncbi:unnamed protein product [Boreogadus saida]